MKESASRAETEIEVRHCHSMPEFRECVQIELQTWGPYITVPTAIFVVAHHTGGQILGAFDGQKMVGFTLALAGARDGTTFLHSHMTAVLPEYRDKGVGRKLKLFQRRDALRMGYPVVEWTFDPLELKNGRFNFVRLGAIARRFIPNCYGITESPLHMGLPTDRLVAEWWLDSERVNNILADMPPATGDQAVRISLPSDIGKLKAEDGAAGARIQTEIREQFQKRFADGYATTGMDFRDSVVDYILEPAAAIVGLQLPAPGGH